MASNIQRGPTRMDAGDWIRMKRLAGAKMYKTQNTKDTVNPSPRLEPESGRRVYTEFGISKIRRVASDWTNYVASQTGDYVLENTNPSNGIGKQLTVYKVCSCQTKSAIKHNWKCPTCN
jgi:hypothetical protein